jgi:hypothetical protein
MELEHRRPCGERRSERPLHDRFGLVRKQVASDAQAGFRVHAVTDDALAFAFHSRVRTQPLAGGAVLVVPVAQARFDQRFDGIAGAHPSAVRVPLGTAHVAAA